MSKLVVISLLTPDPKSGDYAKLREAKDKAVQEVTRVFKTYGLEIIGFEGIIDDGRREDHIRLSPKRVHYGMAIYPCCSKTMTVPKSRITEDPKKVTCKPCLARLAKVVKQEELSLGP